MLSSHIIREHIHPAAPQPSVEKHNSITQGIFLSEFLNRINNAVKKSIPDTTWVCAEVNRITIKDTSNKQTFYIIDLIEMDEGKQKASAQTKIWPEYLIKIEEFEKITRTKLDKGIKILIKVKASIHTSYGLQIQVVDIDPNYTLGDVIARKNFIRDKLKSEGIFDKNKILLKPQDFINVVVISPRNAAGLGDFQASAKILEEFNLCQFTYLDATFQSKQAPESIIQALRRAFVDVPNADVLVLIRGGGASSDLHWLEDENLAREICISAIPVFTGIGHEKDNTIIDEVANYSFDTPSKVIEYIKSSIYIEANKAESDWKNINAFIEKKSSNHHLKITNLRQEIEVSINNKIKKLEKELHVLNQSIVYAQENYIQKRDVSLNNLFDLIRMETQNSIKQADPNANNLINSITTDINRIKKISAQKPVDFYEEIGREVNKLIYGSERKTIDYLNEMYANFRYRLSNSEMYVEASIEKGESALGTSPNAALRTVRERLRSYSSHYPTGDPRPNLQ